MFILYPLGRGEESPTRFLKENINVSLFTDSMWTKSNKTPKQSICDFTKPAANKVKRPNQLCFHSPETKKKSEIKIYRKQCHL